jgi:hypothetical protein
VQAGSSKQQAAGRRSARRRVAVAAWLAASLSEAARQAGGTAHTHTAQHTGTAQHTVHSCAVAVCCGSVLWQCAVLCCAVTLCCGDAVVVAGWPARRGLLAAGRGATAARAKKPSKNGYGHEASWYGQGTTGRSTARLIHASPRQAAELATTPTERPSTVLQGRPPAPSPQRYACNERGCGGHRGLSAGGCGGRRE